MAETPALEPLPPRLTAAVLADVLLPLIARGLIIRRRGAVGLLARLDAERRAIERLRQVRELHGPGPVVLRLPRRRLALVLTSSDARCVLDRSPDPFTPASREKRAALARFEPHGVLISPTGRRPRRRAFNEQALQTGRPVHQLGPAIAARVTREVDGLLTRCLAAGRLPWPLFQRSFSRLTRGVVLGDAGAEDEQLGAELDALRADANWSYLRPQRRGLRERFLSRLRGHLLRADGDALAGHLAALADRPSATQEAVQQVPQWLFAFDAAAIASLTALALLSTHPAALAAARAEAEAGGGAGVGERSRAGDGFGERSGEDVGVGELPFLRACLLESLRLWPTTPAILRDTTSATNWAGRSLPAGSGVLIFAPLFHRDPTLAGADQFAPDRWLTNGGRLRSDDADPSTALLGFSRGAAGCPGRELVLLVSSQLLARILLRTNPRLAGRYAGALRPGHPLPATLNHFALEFAVSARTPNLTNAPERSAA